MGSINLQILHVHPTINHIFIFLDTKFRPQSVMTGLFILYSVENKIKIRFKVSKILNFRKAHFYLLQQNFS